MTRKPSKCYLHVRICSCSPYIPNPLMTSFQPDSTLLPSDTLNSPNGLVIEWLLFKWFFILRLCEIHLNLTPELPLLASLKLRLIVSCSTYHHQSYHVTEQNWSINATSKLFNDKAFGGYWNSAANDNCRFMTNMINWLLKRELIQKIQMICKKTIHCRSW